MPSSRLRIGWFYLLVAALLSACGTPAQPATQSSPVSTSRFRVAMVLPSAIDDKSWSQSGYEGLLKIKEELNAEIAYSDKVVEAEQEQIIRKYAEEQYDFIIGHGGDFTAAIEKVARDFPRIKFALVSGYQGNNANLGGLSARDWELGYLVGTVAGLKTKSGKISFIAGMPYPHIQEQAKYIEVGAKQVRPDVQVSIRYLESWRDHEKARRVAEEELANGADILIPQADAANQDVIAVAQAAGTWAIGMNADQHALAPQTVLTSGLKNVSILVLTGAKLVKEGRWEGKLYKFGMREGVVDLAPFRGMLTAEEEAAVQEVRAKIMAGQLTPAVDGQP